MLVFLAMAALLYQILVHFAKTPITRQINSRLPASDAPCGRAVVCGVMFQGRELEKFLYLTKVEWADAWIYGGTVPIFLASSYLGDARFGTTTPDENLVHNSPIPIPSLRTYGIEVKNSKNFTMVGCKSNGQPIPDLVGVDYFMEDGLILSFCNIFSDTLGKKLGKSACVKILNIERLKKQLDKQLGCKGQMGNCAYTKDHQRNHFLKSNLDSWQNEYRFFWKTKIHTKVVIPAGTAILMGTF